MIGFQITLFGSALMLYAGLFLLHLDLARLESILKVLNANHNTEASKTTSQTPVGRSRDQKLNDWEGE